MRKSNKRGERRMEDEKKRSKVMRELVVYNRLLAEELFVIV
jgi:hypothetical protein